ncbi:MAG: ribonuclease D [Nitrospirae bacterium]|nr:MAG: ribonuclease D [Nitrospirota bacterium]
MPETTPLIAEPEPFLALVERLGGCRELALDTEANSLHAYREQVCLIQVTARYPDGRRENAIIDPLALEDLSPLAGPLADRAILKLLHGASYDIVCLKRDFNFAIHPIFDTMVAAQLVGLPRHGLADLVDHYFGVKLDKRFQKHDWGRRPLTEEQRLYAILDTYYLPDLYDRMKSELEASGRMDQMAEEMRLLEATEPPEPLPDIERVRRIKGASRLTEPQLRVLLSLWRTRERLAEGLGRPTFKVISNQDLLLLACDQPTSRAALKQTLAPRSPAANRFAKEVLAAIRDGLEDTTPLPPPAAKNGPGRLSRPQERLLARLKEWRNRTAKAEGVPPGMVANNELLHRIAQAEPATLEELARVEGMRQWQVRRHGEALLEVVRGGG